MKESIGWKVNVYSKNGVFMGTIDRTGENLPFDRIVYCRLPCGYSCKFWQTGLSDREYIRRTKHIKKHRL